MADEKKFTQADVDAAVAAANEKHDADISGLKAKVSALIADNKSLKRGATITPEDLHAAEERADKAEARAAEAEKQIKTLTGERDKVAKTLEAEQAFTQKLLIQDGIKTALIAAGVKDEDFLDSLTAKFSTGAVVTSEGDARKAMFGDKDLAVHITEWAATDAGKKYVEAPNNGGGGAPGGKGGEAGADLLKLPPVERITAARAAAAG